MLKKRSPVKEEDVCWYWQYIMSKENKAIPSKDLRENNFKFGILYPAKLLIRYKDRTEPIFKHARPERVCLPHILS